MKCILPILMLLFSMSGVLAQDAGLPPLGKDAILHVGQVVSKYDKFTDKSKIELALPVKDGGQGKRGLYLFAVCIYSGQAAPDNAKVVLGVVSIADKYKFESNSKIIFLVDGQRQVYEPQRFSNVTDDGLVIELLLIQREFTVDELLKVASSTSFAGRAGGYEEFEVSAYRKRALLNFAQLMRARPDSASSGPPSVPLIELPSNFHFVRELGQQTGLPVYTLTLDEETVAAAVTRGEEFQALGVVAQPEADKVGLLFFNSAPQLQLQINQGKGFYLTIEKEVLHVPIYQITGQKDAGRMKLETAMVQISKQTLSKLIKADHVTAQCGVVVYELDRDNIEALKYLAAQIEKDGKVIRH